MSSTFVRIGRFVLDVSLSENHTYESDVTEYPVESGGSVSDNIRPKPIKVSIEGVVSDTPLDSNAANKPVTFADPFAGPPNTNGTNTIAAAAAAGITLEQNANTTNNTAPEVVAFLRSEQALAYLKQIWASRDTVTIRTSLGTFDNMAMLSFNVPRSKDTTGGLKFTAEFQQIQRVTNGRVRTAIRNGTGKRNRGAQGADDWYTRQTIWRKAYPPGSDNIQETFEVTFYWKPKGIEAGTQASDAGRAALGLSKAPAALPVSAGLGNTAKWYFTRPYQAAPLDKAEEIWLGKDLARDQRKLAEYKNAHGFTPQNRVVVGNGIEDPLNPTKRATIDYSHISPPQKLNQNSGGNFNDSPIRGGALGNKI